MSEKPLKKPLMRAFLHNKRNLFIEKDKDFYILWNIDLCKYLMIEHFHRKENQIYLKKIFDLETKQWIRPNMKHPAAPFQYEDLKLKENFEVIKKIGVEVNPKQFLTHKNEHVRNIIKTLTQ